MTVAGLNVDARNLLVATAVLVAASFAVSQAGLFSLASVPPAKLLDSDSCTRTGQTFSCDSRSQVRGDRVGGVYGLDSVHAGTGIENPAVISAYRRAGYTAALKDTDNDGDVDRFVDHGNVTGSCTLSAWKASVSTEDTGPVTVSFHGEGRVVNGIQCQIVNGTFTCESGDCGFDTVALDNIDRPDNQNRFKISDLLANMESGYAVTYRLDDAATGGGTGGTGTGGVAADSIWDRLVLFINDVLRAVRLK